MNNYETVILISNNIKDEERKSVVDKIINLINANGTITKVDEIGLRKLAYEVRNHNEAFYYVIYFESEPNFIAELERNYRIIDEILKFIVVKQDE